MNNLSKSFRVFPNMFRLPRLLLLAVIFTFFLAPKTRALAGREQPNEYAQLLSALADSASTAQIELLQRFLAKHPEDERAYLKLLERYQFSQMSSAAKAFFQELAAKPKHHRTSLWMLAKIESCDTLAQAQNQALAAFSEALLDSLRFPSPALVYDFVAFCHQNSDRLDHNKLMRNHVLRSEDLTLAFVFYSYLNEDFKQAAAAFNKASPANRKDPLLLYVLSDCFLRDERTPPELRWAQADSICRYGLIQAQQDLDLEWQARFWARLGDIAFAKDDFAQARASFNQAYDLARVATDLYSLQKALGGLGKLHHMKGNYSTADSLYQEAISVAERICEYRDLSLIYSNYCQLLTELGRFAQALQAGAQSLFYALRAHDEEGRVRIQLKLARLYHDLRQSEFAGKICTDARDLALRRNYVRLYHRAGALLADILARERRFQEARELYDSHLAYLNDMGSSFLRHNYIAKKADTHKDEGPEHYDEAITLYKQASQEAAAVNAEYYQAWYLLEIADLETKRGRLDQAAQALTAISPAVLGESEEGLIRFKLSWGQFFQKREEWDRAIAAYREAAAVIDSTRPQFNLDHLRIGYFSDRARAAQGLAECFYQRYQIRQAAADRDSLFHYMEKAQGYQTRQATADRDSLFHYMEMAKARSFHDLLDQRQNARDSDTIDAGSERDYLRECEELQKLQRRLRLAPEEYESLRSRLEAARYSVVYLRPRMRSSQQALHPQNGNGVFSFAEAQKFLRQNNAALLLYNISEDTAFVLVVSATDSRTLPLRTTRAQLAAICDTLMSPFHAGTLRANAIERLPFHAGLAHRLYELLVKPAEEAVALPKQLIVVPDAALTTVPFEMFLTKAQPESVYVPADSASYAEDFLLHRYAFVYSPSFGLLKKNLRAASPARGVLVLANPLQQAIILPRDASAGKPERILEPLPFTELEAERIQNISAHTTKYTRAQATEAAFFGDAPQQHRTKDTRARATEAAFFSEAAQQHRVVHFATHAFVDSVFDAFSGLVLAMSNDSTDDGLLMGYEIADRDLSYDLVTLSACETGVGDLMEGEGVLGLPRLFLRSGAKSVLMTLWQVDDQFAAELIPRFYEYYLNDGLPKAAALAEAKRELLRENTPERGIYHQHPFYWAAFTLYGDPGQKAESIVTPRLVLMLVALVLIMLSLLFYFRYRSRKAFSYEP